MGDPPPHLYQREALRRGLDATTLSRAMEVNRTVAARGATPILTLAHLAQLTGVSRRYLREIIARRRDPYLSIDRPKPDGRTREISSPEPVLMDVQRWILRRVLTACTPDASSYAYQRHRSIVDCATRHVGARWLVKLDIHSFFDNIREHRVFPIFADLGYPRLLSLELTRLCTRASTPQRHAMGTDRYEGKAPYFVATRGRLPQGAPTSGALANLVMKEVDAELSTFADDQGLVFTRYSDDITFSAGPSFTRAAAVGVVRRVSDVLEEHGLAIHRSKIRIVPPGARRIVLGLLIDEDRVRLLPEYKRRLEVHIRGVQKFGLTEHAQHRGFDSVLAMINHVDGCIAFAASVDFAFGSKTQGQWNLALRQRGYPRPD